MPAAILIPALATIGAGGAAAAANIYGARKAGQANDAAARVQAQSNTETLQLAREQDAEAKRQFDAQQAAAEAQWNAQQNLRAPYRAAGQQALMRLGDLTGMHFTVPDTMTAAAPAIPTDSGPKTGAKSGAPGSAASGGPLPGVDPTKGDIGGQISAFFKSRGVSDQETPYWVQKWGEFGQRDPAYFNTRLAQADIFRGGQPASAPSANRPAAPASMAPFMAMGSPMGGPILPSTLPLRSLIRR